MTVNPELRHHILMYKATRRGTASILSGEEFLMGEACPHMDIVSATRNMISEHESRSFAHACNLLQPRRQFMSAYVYRAERMEGGGVRIGVQRDCHGMGCAIHEGDKQALGPAIVLAKGS